MSINGTIGTLARYNNENIMLGKSVAYITPKNINRDFLFYQLQGDVIQSYFYKNLTGTTIKNLGLGVNDTLRMYKNDDIRMYNFDCITDTIVEVISTCNTYTLLTVHLL